MFSEIVPFNRNVVVPFRIGVEVDWKCVGDLTENVA